MMKAGLRLSAAMALAIVATSPAIAAKLRLPPARAPDAQIYAPTAIASDLQKRGYRIESMKRQGTAYSIKAVGPHKNKVQLMVDGRSGEIVGLAVLEAAANAAAAIVAAMRSGKNARYVDDLHPFGIIVPDTYQKNWLTITSWTMSPGAPVYTKAPKTGRGYRYAVPSRSVRPGRGGRSRSTIPAARMQQPQYDVYESNGAEMETVSYSEDTTIISEVTTEETTYSEEYSAIEESYLGGELGDESYDEVVDYDAEDGDYEFADDTSDGYDAELGETDDVDDDEAGDDDDVGETGETSDDEGEADEGEADDDEGDEEAEEEEEDGVEDDEGEEEESDDGGDEEDYDDGGDEDYGDDGGDDPEAGGR